MATSPSVNNYHIASSQGQYKGLVMKGLLSFDGRKLGNCFEFNFAVTEKGERLVHVACDEITTENLNLACSREFGTLVFDPVHCHGPVVMFSADVKVRAGGFRLITEGWSHLVYTFEIQPQSDKPWTVVDAPNTPRPARLADGIE